MLQKYLPPKIYDAIVKEYNIVNINEIRMRMNAPILLDIMGEKYRLKSNIIVSKSDIESFVYKICDNSLYVLNDCLKQGFITLQSGIRVGLSGEVVTENNIVKTLKNYQSVNIRIPHEVINCSLFAYEYLHNNDVYNSLIISPPAGGKTTFLRDLVRQVSVSFSAKNILIADERGEIVSAINGEPQIYLGANVDVYTYCSKKYAFEYGIRSMNPDIFVVDELSPDHDLETLKTACNSGVKVIATIHANTLEDAREKLGSQGKDIFKRYVVLSKENGSGTLSYIFDEHLHCMYCR